MSRSWLAGVLAGAALFTVHAAASGAQAPETVVVTADRPHSVPSAVSTFLTKRQSYTRIDQIGRWHDPICPTVTNLAPAYGAFIVARIKAVARRVGAPAKEPCTPNVEVIFTPKPQEVMDWIAEHRPALLGYHYLQQTKALATVTSPIQAWYVTATSNGLETVIDDPYHQMPSGTAGSRLTHGLRNDIVHVLILVNSDVAAGLPVGPVADYIAMLALSEVHPQGDCVELSSILNYMTEDCPAERKTDALTAADEAYLQALYAMPPGAIGFLQRSAIYNRMTRSLGAPR